MKYHAPTKSFVVNGDSYEMAALNMKCAIRHIRTLAGLPLEPHKGEEIGRASCRERVFSSV